MAKQFGITFWLLDLLYSYYLKEHEEEKRRYTLVWKGGPQIVLNYQWRIHSGRNNSSFRILRLSLGSKPIFQLHFPNLVHSLFYYYLGANLSPFCSNSKSHRTPKASIDSRRVLILIYGFLRWRDNSNLFSVKLAFARRWSGQAFKNHPKV